MPDLATPPAFADETRKRAHVLFAEHREKIYRRTDTVFAWLMPCQWLAAILTAVWISPRTWSGLNSSIHPHLWAALLLGGVVTLFPLFLVWTRPGLPMTRHTVAIGQMLMGGLLIHLTGGRIETHFHVFGSLAFLAFYRDWRVLLSASTVVALDHFFRGLYAPQSVFGVLAANPFRWLEHAGWVAFEDLFLIISIRQGLNEILGIAERQAELEATNEKIERKVGERTAELTSQITERKEAERALESANARLREVSRQAGMAEVATNVLHNIGNVLNSMNISVSVATDKVRQLKIGAVGKTAGMLREHGANLGEFLSSDRNGRRLPDFMTNVAERLAVRQAEVLGELAEVASHVDHIKQVVAMQQAYAKTVGITEVLPLDEIVEEALRLNAAALERDGVQIVREYARLAPLAVDRHKVLQILVNLVANAKNALCDSKNGAREITLRIDQHPESVSISVADKGVGIPAENLTRIFEHGFTTRPDGHGFGLHSGALAAREMKGHLTGHSDGPGRGAVFTLELPAKTEVSS